MRCGSVYGRLSIDISSKDFSTHLPMILLTPQRPVKPLVQPGARNVILSIAVLLIAHTVSLGRLSTVNRISIHAHRTRTSVPLLSPGVLFGVEIFRLVAQLSWTYPT
ncbi:hypothetical protein HFO88_25875 [Rhizobium leguminosarum]|uniref:hypothetical protein n=1 Tax=Rhizobium leguminosarum TaxID=384 RepID=UPI001C969153|nr:hypothetical protein [Rhizobium leguminosarum]MBY5903750.1 hypothetical protein [Rhizobium leguminosarum]MBY5910848.1 hypothetical protein [Rhizobium leguminosarum]MBY5919172.1 hypothetical protein [Rhizobium leguminosarum]